jgi:hypothetical protein
MEYAEYFPQDLACQIIASDAGYGPKVYFANQAGGVSAIEYFELETFPEMPLRLLPLVELIKRIHAGPSVPKGIDKAKDLNESVDAVAKLYREGFKNRNMSRRRPEFESGEAGVEAAKLRKFSDAGGSQNLWLPDEGRTDSSITSGIQHP